MNLASLADMTRKLAFILTLASARGNSEVWAFSADVRFGLELPEAPAFRAVFRFRQAVVSAKIVGLKTTDPSKPAPEHKFRSLLCAFIGGTWILYPSRQCQGGSDI